MKVRGFADLAFVESAGLSFARAVERAATDPAGGDPEAWFIEERHITFNLDRQLGVAEIDAHRRFLEELVHEASSGEASLDVDGHPRWSRVAPAAAGGSGIAGARVSGERPTGARPSEDGGDPERPTIRNRTA